MKRLAPVFAVAVAALVAGTGPVRAAEPTLGNIAIVSAFLSKNTTTQQTIALVTVKNSNAVPISSLLLDCTAIGNDQQPEEVATVAITNFGAGEIAYGQALFQNTIESGSRVSCRIAQAYR